MLLLQIVNVKKELLITDFLKIVKNVLINVNPVEISPHNAVIVMIPQEIFLMPVYVKMDILKILY